MSGKEPPTTQPQSVQPLPQTNVARAVYDGIPALSHHQDLPAETRVALGALTLTDLHDRYAVELGREDELANQRTSWILGSTTVFMATFAGVLVALTSSYSDFFGKPAGLILTAALMVLAAAGMVVARTQGLSIVAASDAWTIWHERYVEAVELALQRGFVDVRSLPWCDRAGRRWMHPGVRVSVWNVLRWGRATPKRATLSDDVDTKGGIAQRMLGPSLFWLWATLFMLSAIVLGAQLLG